MASKKRTVPIHSASRGRLLKTVCLLLCVLFITFSLGCNAAAEYPGSLSGSTMTPPAGSRDDTFIDVTLFFPTSDNRTLGSETRTLARPVNVSRAQCALEALSQGPQSDTLAGAVPEGWALSKVELSGDVCNIYFTGTPATEDELVNLRAAAAATVYANEGIAYTDIFLNTMQPGYRGNPLGVLSPIDIPLDSYRSAIRRDNSESSSPQGEANALVSRNAQLYFTDLTGSLLLCDVREISYQKQEQANIVIAALMGELAKGPLGSEGREPVLPPDMRLIKCVLPASAASSSSVPDDIPLSVGTDGQLVDLYFSVPERSVIAPIVYASIVYTVTGFFPQTGGVRIFLNETMMTVNEVLHNGDGGAAFSRADFSGMLGHTVALMFPDQDGIGLYPVLRCLPQSEAYDLKARLTSLFTGPADPGIPLAMLDASGVESVSLHGNMAIVNFHEGFFDRLRTLVESGVSHLPQNTRAQMTVFSIVNTLASIPGIEKVWLLENGTPIDRSINLLYMGSPLFYNPGLMLSGESADA